MDKKITDSIIYIGVDDKDIDLFESQYVVPNGVSYNSYVIMDDKIAIMDTADARVTDKWFANLRIIVTTLQKFPVIYQEVDKVTESRIISLFPIWSRIMLPISRRWQRHILICRL